MSREAKINGVSTFDFSGIQIMRSFEDEILFLEDLREIKNLPSAKTKYNTIVFCQGGRILVEIGGNVQVNVKPNQLLLIPTGKLVQPIMVSTDVEASVMLISDRMLKSILGNQINIWNKAMFLKEIYIVKEADWIDSFRNYAHVVYKNNKQIFNSDHKEPFLANEIAFSFLRTMLLIICEDLLRNEKMTMPENFSTSHDKEIFNRFLQILSNQKKKRQRVSFYADQMNITPKYLSVISKRVSGKNPMRWITESVMEDSYALLKKTDLSIKEIANQLGFPNPSFFGQYFRVQTGMTPADYRKKNKRLI